MTCPNVDLYVARANVMQDSILVRKSKTCLFCGIICWREGHKTVPSLPFLCFKNAQPLGTDSVWFRDHQQGTGVTDDILSHFLRKCIWTLGSRELNPLLDQSGLISLIKTMCETVYLGVTPADEISDLVHPTLTERGFSSRAFCCLVLQPGLQPFHADCCSTHYILLY